jgi:hypothetical protein
VGRDARERAYRDVFTAVPDGGVGGRGSPATEEPERRSTQ